MEAAAAANHPVQGVMVLNQEVVEIRDPMGKQCPSSHDKWLSSMT